MKNGAHVAVDVRLLRASGIGTYLRNLLPKVLDGMPDVRFSLLGRPAEVGAQGLDGRANVAVVPCDAPVYSIAEQLALARATPRDVDLFWAPHYNIPLAWRGALVVTVYDLCHLAVPEAAPGLHKRAYARFMFNAVGRRSRRIVCISRFTETELLRLVRVDRGKIRMIHFGVDPTWFDIRPERRPHARPFLLYVGNVKPHKNLVGLLCAFELLRGDIPHDLLIVGKREGFITTDERVAAKAKELGDRVVFTGEFDNADPTFRQFFAHADALVLPSKYEGFGLPPVEAMACGCPVIVSRAASLPEVCGEAALYCDPDSPNDIATQIRRLLGDAVLQDSLRARGRQQARRYSWQRCAADTVAVFNDLLRSGSRA